MASIFMKIMSGELPCYKIFEDEHTFAFLALHQIQLGHTLVIPKKEFDQFLDVPEPYYSAVFQNAKPIGQAIREVTQCQRVGGIIQGFEVRHFHLHLVPMWDPSDLSFAKGKARADEEMKEVQQKIIETLHRIRGQ